MDTSKDMTQAELAAQLATLALERYAMAADAANVSEVDALASQAGDCEYLMARIRCLDATQGTALDDTAWISPANRSTPAQALQRIRAVCAQFPDLFNAMFVIAATHQSVSREMLALAIKQFRRDTDHLSKDDVMGLLGSIATGGYQAFDAVLRSRKGVERKAVSFPWGKDTD